MVDPQGMKAKLTDRDALIPVVVAGVAITLYGYEALGLAFWLPFIPAMVLALACYLLTSYRASPQPARVLPLYLIALAVQFLHFTEEYLTGLYDRLPLEIFHAPPADAASFVGFNMVHYAAFTLAAAGLYRGLKFTMLLVWFLAIAGVIGNAVAHLIFAILVRGYFPGLYTSLLYWLIGPPLLKRLWE